MAYNLKTIKKEFSQKGIFYTEKALAEYVKSFLPDNVTEVYDPTCGNGGLLSVFDDNVLKYGQEINEEQLKDAKKTLINFTGICGDTLKNPAFMERKFKAIVANPPFGINWEPPKMDLFDKDVRFVNVPVLPPKGAADFAFFLHILYLLADDGIAVVLDSRGPLFRGGAEGKIRRWFVENNYVDKIVFIPEKQFIDTAISTVIWVLKKNRTETSIEFSEMNSDWKKSVSFEEIAKNDFTLEINRYKEIIYEKIEYPSSSEMLVKMCDDIVTQMDSIFELMAMLNAEVGDECFISFVDKINNSITKQKNSDIYKRNI